MYMTSEVRVTIRVTDDPMWGFLHFGILGMPLYGKFFLHCLQSTYLSLLAGEFPLTHYSPQYQAVCSLTRQVVLGTVTIARSRVESKEEIRARLEEALKYIPRYSVTCSWLSSALQNMAGQGRQGREGRVGLNRAGKVRKGQLMTGMDRAE